jgi:hypothetical protein
METQQKGEIIVAVMPESLLEFAKNHSITQEHCGAAVSRLTEPPSRKDSWRKGFASLLVFVCGMSRMIP